MITSYKITVEHDENINPDEIVDYAERILQIALKANSLKAKDAVYEIGNLLAITSVYQSELVKMLGLNPTEISESQIFAYLEQLEVLCAIIMKMMTTLKGDKHELHTNDNG